MDWSTLYEHFVDKLKAMVHTLWGWFLILCGVLVEYFGSYKAAIVAVSVVIVFDAIWGILAAKKQGKYTKSELLRDTFTKIIAYFGTLAITVLMERIVEWDWFVVTNTVGVLIVATEMWSISGNMLIVNPNMVFFKLLRPALKGEIARKLGIAEDDVDKVLNEEIERDKDRRARRKKKKDTTTS